MCTGFPRLGVLRRLRPAPDRSADGEPSPTSRAGRTAAGMDRGGSHVHCDSLDEGGAQLCPCGFATPTPQQFRRGLPNRHPQACPGVPRPPKRDGCAPRPAHIRQVRAGLPFKGRTHAGSSRTPLRHAGRTHAIWQCWRVPALSRLLPPIPAPPGIRLPPASPALLRQVRRRRSLTSARIVSASWRTLSRPRARCRGCSRSVSLGRSPNPACGFHRTGLSTVPVVRRGWAGSRGWRSCFLGSGSG